MTGVGSNRHGGWARLSGPLATVALAVGLRVLQVTTGFTQLSAVSVLLLACVVFSVLYGGWRAGLVSGAVSIGAYAWLRSSGSWQFDQRDAVQIVVDLVVTVPIVIVLGRMVSRLDRMAIGERTLRHEAEAARAETTEILGRITDGFIAMDREWRYVYVNEQAEKLIGRTHAELIGVLVWDAFPPLVGSTWEREYRKAVETGEAVHFDEYYPPLDMWFETHAYPSANGLSIYLRDVTERVRANKVLKSRVLQQTSIAAIGQLALAGKSFQTLLHEAVTQLVAVFEVDLAKAVERLPDGNLILRAGVGWKPGVVGTAVIEAAHSQAGYTLAAGEPVIVDDLRTERRFHGPQLLVDHGVISGMSVAIPGHDEPYGILAVHSTTPRAFTRDDVAFLQGMAQVLGLALAWNRATTELRDSELRFRQLADNLREVLFVTDVELRDPGYVSPTFEDVFGLPVATWYANPAAWVEAVHPGDRARVEAALDEMRSGDFDVEFRILRSDNTIRWIHTRAFGVGDESARLRRVVGIAEDITEARRLADERTARAAAEARAAADARAAARDEVLAIVSHDLRNPLGSIELAAGALELTAHVPPDNRQLQIIHRAARQMTVLIQQLLDAARIDSGTPLALTRVDLDAGPLLARLRETTAMHAEQRNIVLDVHVEPDLPHVFADGDRVLQALDNLVGNALKFTPRGGHIWVDAIAVTDRVRFSVSDTGPGIPPEHAARLFERYWQARADRRGIGLGLPIVKGIADAHGGRVWTEPRPGGGTTFHLELPAIVQPPAALTALDTVRASGDDAKA